MDPKYSPGGNHFCYFNINQFLGWHPLLYQADKKRGLITKMKCPLLENCNNACCCCHGLPHNPIYPNALSKEELQIMAEECYESKGELII